jgi:hypothetical protein
MVTNEFIKSDPVQKMTEIAHLNIGEGNMNRKILFVQTKQNHGPTTAATKFPLREAVDWHALGCA